MTIESTAGDAMGDVESDTARWKVLLNDPEFMETLLAGVPKRPKGWWHQDPDEDAIAYMFRIFPVVRLQ